MIRVRVLAFGVLKDSLGSNATEVKIPEGATVGDLLAQVAREHPDVVLRGIAVSVNAEYAVASRSLCEDDEVGLLPPVSGGAEGPDLAFLSAPGCQAAVGLCRSPIDSAAIVDSIKRPEDGAVVVFDGIVRNHSRGRQTLYLDYEAYEEMADKQMRELAHEATAKFAVRQVVLVHRLGRLEVGETSVLIVVASAHRAQAYEASRWLIDTLKRTVPIWKKETFVDGVVWADGEPFPPGFETEATDAS